MDTLYIVIPAYNEASNIVNCINEWHEIIKRYGNDSSRLVVINDGSKDNTSELIKQCQKEMPKLLCLNKSNGGHGSAVLYGYRYAVNNKADFIFQTDSDGQTNPQEFKEF